MVDEQMKLQGFCMDEQGCYGEPIRIDNLEDFSTFVSTNVEKYFELRVTDREDNCVFHVIDRVLKFPIPEHGSENNRWDPVTQQFKNI